MRSTRSDKLLCDICKKARAPYSCPSCNWNYCSIACFRDAAHSDCSEKFYKNSILTESNSSEAEKLETLRMLKRLQEDEQGAGDFMQLLRALEDADAGDQDIKIEDDENDDFEDEDEKLVHTLENINLDTLSSKELFRLLGKNQAEEFLSLVHDSKASQALIKSLPVKKPWWERPFLLDYDNQKDFESQYTPKPEFVSLEEIPQIQSASAQNPRRMLWNVVAILISYTHIIRTIDSTGSDIDASVTLLRRLAPFLFEHSNVIFQSLEDVLSTVFATIESDSQSLYLNDTATLLAPRPVTVLSTESSVYSETLESHQNRDSLRAFSHISHIVKKQKRARLKCLFYIALLKDPLTPNIMREASKYIRLRAENLEKEQKNYDSVEESIQWIRSIDNSKPSTQHDQSQGNPLIQELK